MSVIPEILIACEGKNLAKGHSYEKVGCVSDKDDFPNCDFDNAVSKAQANGFEVAYSNQAFEYWIILHFRDHQGSAMDRKQYAEIINEELSPFGLKYEGNGCKVITSEIFNVLQSKDEEKNTERSTLAILLPLDWSHSKSAYGKISLIFPSRL
ncbi:MAG: RloB family protein [Spirochaetia bacterium]|jgi:hypothetical protein|nr:RloB family protein [Spirochaetia bacterium]